MHAQPSPPAPAASAQLRNVHGASVQAAECDVCDYEDQLIEARRISRQACAAIFAGMLGILAIILEPVGRASGGLIGPGIFGGVWCIAQAVWAGFLLFNARKVMTLHAYYRRIRSGARSPMSTSLQCNASALTTFTAFTFLGLVVCGWISIIYLSEGYGTAVGAILFFMAVVTLTASILGCCAICKSGCAGCGCCDYPVYTPSGHNGQQLHCASVVDSSPNFQVTTVRVANPLNL